MTLSLGKRDVAEKVHDDSSIRNRFKRDKLSSMSGLTHSLGDSDRVGVHPSGRALENRSVRSDNSAVGEATLSVLPSDLTALHIQEFTAIFIK